MAFLASNGTLSLGVAFWVIMLIWLVFGVITGWPKRETNDTWRLVGGHLVLWFLLFLLGWSEFGFIIGK